MTDNTLPEVPGLEVPAVQETRSQPFDIAVIIDNVVYQVINTDGQFAAQLLAQPKFVQVLPSEAKVGWIYNESDNTFTQPEVTGL
jgi:hypothetical protein